MAPPLTLMRGAKTRRRSAAAAGAARRMMRVRQSAAERAAACDAKCKRVVRVFVYSNIVDVQITRLSRPSKRQRSAVIDTAVADCRHHCPPIAAIIADIFLIATP
jgi:hypothetical protein